MTAGKLRYTRRVRRGVGGFLWLLIAAVAVYYADIAFVRPHPGQSWLTAVEQSPLTGKSAVGVAVALKLFHFFTARLSSDERDRETALRGHADALARNLSAAVDAEIKNRGLLDPEPLPVRWRRAVWDPVRPDELTAEGPTRAQPLAEVAAAVPPARQASQGSRIVLTGGPGAGKTAVTLHLQRGLLLRRSGQDVTEPPEPVPVIISLATWRPEVDFHAWAVARLTELVPQLALPVPGLHGEDSPPTGAAALLDEARVLLILDGMDEVSPAALRRVFAVVDDSLRPSVSVIVACRTEGFTKSFQVTPEDGPDAGRALRHATVFELQPSEPGDVAAYLTGSAKPGDRHRWDPVVGRLAEEPDGPLARALSTPLLAWLMVKNYRHRTELLTAEVADRAFADADEVADQLLDGLVASVFPADARGRTARERRHAAGAERWLRFLAAWVVDRGDHDVVNVVHALNGERQEIADNGQDIAWWRLTEHPAARRTSRISAGVFSGLVIGGAVGLGFGAALWSHGHRSALLVGASLGTVFALVMGADGYRQTPPPTSIRFGRPTRWGARDRRGLRRRGAGQATAVCAGPRTGRRVPARDHRGPGPPPDNLSPWTPSTGRSSTRCAETRAPPSRTWATRSACPPRR